MRIAEAIGLSAAERSALHYALLLLKDIGCSNNAARMAALFGSDDRARHFMIMAPMSSSASSRYWKARRQWRFVEARGVSIGRGSAADDGG